ncbi:MAG: site-specific DNA-methyltransferase [Bacteroidales bacterium]|nr:site-specific DNA-methyltransferase [Bacteroidales bacterium]
MGKIDRAALRQRIQTLEGLTDEERAALLELAATKRYGLVWEEREEAVEERLREELPVLIEDKSLAILPRLQEGDGGRLPNHILIEGDNLEALTTLSYTHEGKVDVIYIDPPYNTGNKDFVYNDSFVDSEDSYRHSKWLSFMSKRLRIAKRLLSDRGVIFISIDDNEQANLKLLCDEVFGENTFIGLISRATGTTTGQDTGSLGKACDYILAYSKQADYMIGGIPLSDKDLGRYDMTDEKGAFSILQLRRTGGEDRREDRPTMFFPIEAPDGMQVYPYGPTGYESRWRVGPETVVKMRKDNLLYFKKDKKGDWKVYYKFYAEGKTKRPSNLWTDLDGNKKAQIELKGIIPDVKFETPKPIQVIKRILELTTDKDSIVLDFFAGSGTTLHAVMQLNKEDGGKRQCILVTNNENNICREVTYERNRRVIEGYTTPKGTQVEGLHDNNLRYYRTRLLPRERTNRNMRRLVAASTDLLCIKEGLFGLTPGGLTPGPSPLGEGGRMLTPNDVRMFSDGERAMMVIYNEEVIPEIVEWIKHEFPLIDHKLAADHSREKIKIYVFSPGAYAWDDDFSPVIDKVELCALPEAIYQAYKSVLPKKRVRRETAEGLPKEGGEE